MPGAWTSRRRVSVDGDGTLAVDGLAQGVDDPTEQAVAHRHRQDAPGGPDQLLLFDVRVAAEDHRTDGVLVEVQRDAERAVFELEQLVHRHHGQPADPGDAVSHLGDASHLLGGDLGCVVGDVSLQRGRDLVGVDGQLCHQVCAPRVAPSRLRRCSST